MAELSLPSFAAPPVTEVVVAVAFRPLDGLSVPRIGHLWAEEFEEEFSRAEEHAPYDPPIERLDQSIPASVIDFRFGVEFPAPRVWLLNESGDEIVQIQRNYFACNWRKVQPNTKYERWESRRSSFQGSFSRLGSFVSRHGLGEIRPTQCEVTYVNHIEAGEGWSSHADVRSIFRFVGDSANKSEGFYGRLEQMAFGAQYQIDKEGKPIGRLHVAASPGLRHSDNSPLYQLQLTARGRPLSAGAEGILSFADEGRKAIVTAFAAMTTPGMHKIWRRNE